MTGSNRSSHDLDPRRRRALFRAWRRGTREMDLIFGRFADAHIADLDDRDLADFEALMDVPENEAFAWVTGQEPVATRYKSPVFNSIVAFYSRANDEA